MRPVTRVKIYQTNTTIWVLGLFQQTRVIYVSTERKLWCLAYSFWSNLYYLCRYWRRKCVVQEISQIWFWYIFAGRPNVTLTFDCMKLYLPSYTWECSQSRAHFQLRLQNRAINCGCLHSLTPLMNNEQRTTQQHFVQSLTTFRSIARVSISLHGLSWRLFRDTVVKDNHVCFNRSQRMLQTDRALCWQRQSHGNWLTPRLPHKYRCDGTMDMVMGMIWKL